MSRQGKTSRNQKDQKDFFIYAYNSFSVCFDYQSMSVTSFVSFLHLSSLYLFLKLISFFFLQLESPKEVLSFPVCDQTLENKRLITVSIIHFDGNSNRIFFFLSVKREVFSKKIQTTESSDINYKRINRFNCNL